MNSIAFSQLIPVLQVAVGPAILISGVGLVLMLLTTRLGRAVDRVRLLARELREATPEQDRQKVSSQIGMLFRRARLIRGAIALAGISALLAALMVITLFISVLWHFEIGMMVSMLFILCLLSLIGSLAAFILDVQWALRALRMELERNGAV
jgi:hypothetical protein